MKKDYYYRTNCVASDARSIDNMVDNASDVTYETLIGHCDGVAEWAKQMGYDRNSKQGLTLKNDWAVSFHKSMYRGRPCYYICHSSIEYIWVKC